MPPAASRHVVHPRFTPVFTLALAAMLLSLVGCGPVTFTIGDEPREAEIESTVVQEDDAWTFNRIAMVDVTGLIVNGSRKGLLSQSENPVGRLHEQLETIRDDDSVKALVLRLNTPGGTVTASDAMYREIERFQRESGKPVIALMMDTAASGGYYIACGADRIVAYPTSVTGSIGVIVQTFSLKPAMSRIGIQAEALTSGKNKDAGSPFSTLTPEHREVLQEMVDDFYGRFRNLVRENRPGIPEDQFDKVTDGRVLTGTDAKELGLVDQNGDLYDAWQLAKRLADVEHAHLALYHRPGAFAGSAYAKAPQAGAPRAGGTGGGTQINLAQINLADTFGIGDQTMTFLYVWRPGLP